MQRAQTSFLALATITLVLVGCTPPQPSTGSSPTPAASAPAASPTPEFDEHLVVTVDGVSFVTAEGTETATYDDSAALLALLVDATGETPAPEELEDLPGYEMNRVSYEWDGLKLLADADNEYPASVAVLAAEVDGIPIATEEGLTVGSSREDVLDADGWDVWDQDGDGTADQLGVDAHEVPGTQSLTNPGSTGILFLLFLLDGDVVTQIQAPGNDFSDL